MLLWLQILYLRDYWQYPPLSFFAFRSSEFSFENAIRFHVLPGI